MWLKFARSVPPPWQMLYQEPGPGLEYEYSVPKGIASRLNDPDSYAWQAEDFSSCSATCGGGEENGVKVVVRRRARSLGRAGGSFVDDVVCSSCQATRCGECGARGRGTWRWWRTACATRPPCRPPTRRALRSPARPAGSPTAGGPAASPAAATAPAPGRWVPSRDAPRRIYKINVF